MQQNAKTFWQHFNDQNFNEADKSFNELTAEERQEILSALFQQGAIAHQPFMISVLRGHLKQDKMFADFYESWLPEDLCDKKIELHNKTYYQGFPSPVRVLNGVNISNQHDVVSIGITWLKSKEDEKKFWSYLENLQQGGDKVNEIRHDRIKDVADRELLGLYLVKSDDNLGTPF